MFVGSGPAPVLIDHMPASKRVQRVSLVRIAGADVFGDVSRENVTGASVALKPP